MISQELADLIRWKMKVGVGEIGAHLGVKFFEFTKPLAHATNMEGCLGMYKIDSVRVAVWPTRL